MSLLFETLRIENGEVMNLRFHCERVSRSCALPLDGFVAGITLPARGGFRLRVDYDTENGFTGYSVTPYTPRDIRTLKTVICDTICYERKFSDRSQLDTLLGMKVSCDDVLIVKDGFVTDTSFANIIFEREGRWFTSDTPLLRGTCRAYLLETGIISECCIRVDDIACYERFMLINAMLPFDESRALPVSNISC